LHHAIADQHIAVIDYPVGKDDTPAKTLSAIAASWLLGKFSAAPQRRSIETVAAPLHPT